jgi:EAL domain-containing protein (putative c-di-GMP-specific phosphodiesterase class I)
MLRALTELRSAGWGIALDDVGADSRSLVLMSVLYPDVPT